ncbi:Hypothetical protein P9211_06501 [Prochlorococcus marinus str. MIT 9211]|uniref:Uncharacterized protein n=1 Tax=Prochlorococcus marinus (strain MIT 9211) TaxID=93059 RepID=A9B9R9_PROM4|nr:Hypothetical protein P9211_06501 [Prochlorococcus marinus str. MIT 9211]
MKLLSITFSEMGLDPFARVLLGIISLTFLLTFFLTTRNMDTKGLLRVLYAKPLRKRDGTVEYRKGN